LSSRSNEVEACADATVETRKQEAMIALISDEAAFLPFILLVFESEGSIWMIFEDIASSRL